MTALPSFVELMASLGLGGPDDTPEPSKLAPTAHHSRTSSHSSTASAFSASSSNVSTASHNIYSLQHKHSSPAIVVTPLDPSSDSEMPTDIRRSRANSRYSPYGSISHSRKASMPTLNGELVRDGPVRALSTSPRLSPISASFRGRRSRRPDNLKLSDSDLMAYTPISSYVRRKTPQNSPTSPSFARDRPRGMSIAQPLAIPTLPTLLSPASFATQSSDSEEDEMDTIPDPEYRLSQQPRISSSPPWQSRYAEPDASPRISICSPLTPDEPSRPQIAPIA